MACHTNQKPAMTNRLQYFQVRTNGEAKTGYVHLSVYIGSSSRVVLPDFLNSKLASDFKLKTLVILRRKVHLKLKKTRILEFKHFREANQKIGISENFNRKFKVSKIPKIPVNNSGRILFQSKHSIIKNKTKRLNDKSDRICRLFHVKLSISCSTWSAPTLLAAFTCPNVSRDERSMTRCLHTTTVAEKSVGANWTKAAIIVEQGAMFINESGNSHCLTQRPCRLRNILESLTYCVWMPCSTVRRHSTQKQLSHLSMRDGSGERQDQAGILSRVARRTVGRVPKQTVSHFLLYFCDCCNYDDSDERSSDFAVKHEAQETEFYTKLC